MSTLVITINWILVISGCCALVGFWAYVIEVFQGRIHRYTTWRELNSYQSELAILILGGTTVFIITLIVAAILK